MESENPSAPSCDKTLKLLPKTSVDRRTCDAWCVCCFVCLCVMWMLVLVCVERCVLTVVGYSFALFRHILEELMNGPKEGFASWCGGFMTR